MKNIYLIIHGQYSDWQILYATEDQAAAEAFVEKYNQRVKSTYDNLYIIEKSLYVPSVMEDKYFNSILEYTFSKQLCSNGYICTTCELVSSKDYEYASALNNKENFETLMSQGYFIHEYPKGYTYYFLHDGNDDTVGEEEGKKLFKIAKDRMAQYVAEKEDL